MKSRLINYVFNLVVEHETHGGDYIETAEFEVRVEAQRCREAAVSYFWRNQQGFVADHLGTQLDKIKGVRIHGIAVAA